MGWITWLKNKIFDDLSSDRNEARSLEGGKREERRIWWAKEARCQADSLRSGGREGKGEVLMKTERCFAEA